VDNFAILPDMIHISEVLQTMFFYKPGPMQIITRRSRHKRSQRKRLIKTGKMFGFRK